jgi:hypothetical protein
MDVLPVRQQAGRLWAYLLAAQRAGSKLVRALDDEGVLRLYLGEGRMKMAIECQHGQLARVCELCERDTEIIVLREQVEKLTEDVRIRDAMVLVIEGQLQKKNVQLAALEAEVAALQAEVLKQVAGSKVVFDRDVVKRAQEAQS